MKTKLRPFRPIKPGEILEEELDARGWSPADFADRMGRPIHIFIPTKEIVGDLSKS